MNIPKHIGLIPDGNRRWAKIRGLDPWEGHAKGIARFRQFIDWCYELGVEEVTAYSISSDNLKKRPKIEIELLFKVYEQNLLSLLESAEISEKGVHVDFVGGLDGIPKRVRDLMDRIVEKSKNNTGVKLNLCVNYSGREEIVSAARAIVKEGMEINQENMQKHLLIKDAPDLLIRTAENRISDFLTWQCAYSEIFFSTKYFPDFERCDLLEAIAAYNKTTQRFGR